MRRRHRRTLERIFARPTPADIRWTDIEALMAALDVEVQERAGSRALFRKGAARIVVHRPHPHPETRRETVRDIARFIESIGEEE